MLTTRFTELVGCSVPIQLAGMGSHSKPRMAAAVANAGGLGMVSVYSIYGGPPENVAKMLESTREQTDGVFGANFILRHVDPDLAHETVRAAAKHADVVDFFYTDPDPAIVETVHSEEALACWQVGSREEAIAAEDAGCDFIIAQGIEAGGHVRGTLSMLALLDQVLEAVKVPVLAAGGIGSGRAMAAALAAGADGVRVGTRFLAVEEAEVHPEFLNSLIAAEAQDTVYTDTFTAQWPAPQRVLRSSIEAVEAFQGDVVGTMADTWNGKSYELKPFECSAIHKSATGYIAAISHLAGESVSGLTKVQTAAEIIRELTTEAESLLQRWN